ncbi:hypothetical protein ACUN22_37705, partial [Streptomyces anulatus]|uniref:hypothetical protein n=1 Tax=Streptomyces anulatus TaxID=1892 RepID=UPI00403D8BE0
MPYDTTNYFRVTDDADPTSGLAGRVVPVVSVDSARLGTHAGARVTALLVRLGPDRGPHFCWYRVYLVDGADSART